ALRRVWAFLRWGGGGGGLGRDDAGCRRLGLGIGLATVAVVWWTSSALAIGPPLLALALFCMSPSVVLYGDMVRGYGLAALAIVWSFGAVWAFVQNPTWRSYAVAQVATIFAAQTHFGNAIPLLGLGVGAAAVCWRRGNVRLLAASLALGAVAAIVLFAVNAPVLAYMRGAGQQEMRASIDLTWLLRVF